MSSQVHQKSIRVYVVAIRDHERGRSPSVVSEKLKAAGFTVAHEVALSDDPEFITDYVREVSTHNRADAMILIGGTGIGRRDQTHDALYRMFEKRIDGFGEGLRRLWFDKVGAQAILTRATAGVVNECVVFSIPSDPMAVELALEQLILPLLERTVDLASGVRDRLSQVSPMEAVAAHGKQRR